MGSLLLTQVSVSGSYFGDNFFGLLVCGLGIGLAFVTATDAALAGVGEHESGLASGLSNTALQIGAALGVAIVSTVAVSRSEDYLAANDGANPLVVLTEGFQSAFLACIVLAAIGVALALLLLGRPRKAPQEQLEPAPATAGIGELALEKETGRDDGSHSCGAEASAVQDKPQTRRRSEMATIVISEFVSLDGVVEDPGGIGDFKHRGWTFEIDRGEEGEERRGLGQAIAYQSASAIRNRWTRAVAEYKLRETLGTEALLLGRITYEEFAALWPSRGGEFADKFNSLPKYVVSSTLEDPGWNNSKVLEGDVGRRSRGSSESWTGRSSYTAASGSRGR